MPEYLSPGVYIEEIETGAMPIEGVSTSTAGFLGETERGPTDPQFLTSFADYRRTFGGYDLYAEDERLNGTHLAYAVQGFFQNGGTRCFVGRITAEEEVAETQLGLFGQRSDVAVATGAHDFGEVPLGVSEAWTLDITNTSGDLDVVVSGVSVTPGAAVEGEFTTNFDPGSPIVVAPGDTEQLEVTFAPQQEGTRDATLDLTHDATHHASPVSVTLTGEGVSPLIPSSETHDFGTTVVGNSEEARWTLRLTNDGASDVSVTTVDITPGDNAQAGEFGTNFDTDLGGQIDVAPGAQAELEVSFDPQDATNPKSATIDLTLTGTDAGGPLTIDVTGTAIDPESGELRVGDFDFGDLETDMVHVADIRVTNIGGAGDDPVTVTNVTTTAGADTADSEFQVAFDTADPPTIQPGQSHEVAVTFAPVDVNNKEATLTVEHGGNNSPETATLSGAGIAPVQVLEIEPETLDFGVVPEGARAHRTLTLTNDATSGSQPIEVTGAAPTAPDTPFEVEDDLTQPLVIQPGASATLTVAYEPEDDNQHSAQLQLQVTGIASSPVNVDLEGVGNGAVFSVEAVGPGVWGRNVAVIVENGSLYTEENSDLFKIIVRYWSRDAAAGVARRYGADPEHDDVPTPTKEEVYDNLSPSETSPEYYVNTINDASNLVEVERIAPGRPSNTAGSPMWLWGEDEGDAELRIGHFNGDANDPPGERSGLEGLKEIDEISLVCVPDENEYFTDIEPSPITDAVRNHCEGLKDRFAVLQAKERAGDLADLSPPVDSTYAAFYYPWLTVIDPLTNAKTDVPPGGHIMGIYARTDSERGVHKAPANVVPRGVIEPQLPLSKAEQDLLNPRGVNCIRSFQARGTRVWGARTTSTNSLWKYLNVRRLFLYIEESIDEGTQWAVFEPNDEKLWARVRQSVSNFLTSTWRDGALQGTTPDQAYFVTCDRSTMTQDDIDNGRLIVEIGIAPVKPAEFVIFRISQWTGGVEGGS